MNYRDFHLAGKLKSGKVLFNRGVAAADNSTSFPGVIGRIAGGAEGKCLCHTRNSLHFGPG